MFGIGGSAGTYFLRDVILAFPRENGKSHAASFDRIYVLKHAVVDEKIIRIPSILGREMLNEYALIYDKKNGTSYITDEDPQ